MTLDRKQLSGLHIKSTMNFLRTIGFNDQRKVNVWTTKDAIRYFGVHSVRNKARKCICFKAKGTAIQNKLGSISEYEHFYTHVQV